MIVSTQQWMVDEAIRQNGNYHAEFYNIPASTIPKLQKHVNVVRMDGNTGKPNIIFTGNYFANGVTFLDDAILDKNKAYSVFVKVNSIQGVHDKVNRIAQDLSLQKIKNRDGIETLPVNFNERVLRLSAQSMTGCNVFQCGGGLFP
jgi:hypothetical protein